MAAKTIEQEIVDWSAARPDWQRAVMRRLARGEALAETDFADLADRLSQASPPPVGDPLTLNDMPRGQAQAPVRVVLRGVRDLTHVNALIPNQKLDFAATGMTVVYGDNGSGKSGYARLLKAVVRARDHEDVRTDIFADAANAQPAATLLVERGATPGEIAWPDGNADELSSVGFYDEACGDKYLTTDTEISYRPSALSIMDGLIRACDGVRAVLDRRLNDNARRAERLPELSAASPPGKYLAGLSAKSDVVALDALCQVSPDIGVQINTLVAEEARLRTLDPAKERSRLLALAGKLERLGQHVAKVAAAISAKRETDLRGLHTALRAAEAVAVAASAQTFEAEPLAGVGSATWNTLWSAARAFAVEGARIDGPFPDTNDGARCVLCQQELDADAADRLRRFEAFVQNKVQAALAESQRAWGQARQQLAAVECEPQDIIGVLVDIDEAYPALAADGRAFLKDASIRRAALLAAGDAATWISVGIPAASPPPNVSATNLRDQANAIVARDHERHLGETIARRVALEDAKKLAESRAAVVAEIARLAERERLESAKGQTPTNAISSKTADLVRERVTAVVRDQFTRETDRLQLTRVTLNDAGQRKGSLRHQAAFIGAVQDAPLPTVLSEGEQTALGLAGFFTEAHLDASCAALVLDDPVCSLDHRRRVKVAQRLAEFAQDRQVVVFTHDLAFVGELAKAAEAAQVPVAERSVERIGSGKPGACRDHHPWKAKDAAQRLNDLAQDLAKLKADIANLDQDGYETRVAEWAGKLSETWERIIGIEVVGKVFDFGTQEVRPRMFRLLSRITDGDDTDFQASYGRVSQWARRHDKSLAVNYVAPTIEDMRKELDSVKGWLDRVKKYKS